jgi:hypothetical protein
MRTFFGLLGTLATLILCMLALAAAGCDRLERVQKDVKAAADKRAEEDKAKLLANSTIKFDPATQLSAPPPADQEISVNLNFAGKQESGKLGFDFKALWGEYKTIEDTLTMPASGSAASSMDLGDLKVTIEPKVTGKTKGKYNITVKDQQGGLVGKYEILESGKPVTLTSGQTPGYTQQLMYFDPERRLTGFKVMKGKQAVGQAQPKDAYGIIFVGKGWSTSENFKGVDTSKGYVFPEIDIVVLPTAWIENKDMARTCDTLKLGTDMGAQTRCYS